MKKNFAYMLMGFIMMGIMINPLSVFSSTVQTYFHTVSITWNGEQITAQGDDFHLEDGTAMPNSIYYNGVIYLPIRKLAQVTDMDIAYSDTDKSVYLMSAIAQSGKYIDFVNFTNLNDIASKADTIITGRVLAKTVNNLNVNLNPDGRPLILKYHVYDVEVVDVLKGNVTVGSTIQIKQEYDEPSYTNYKKDQQGIFFMTGCTENDLPYSTMSPAEGFIGINLDENAITNYPFKPMMTDYQELCLYIKSVSSKR